MSPPSPPQWARIPVKSPSPGSVRLFGSSMSGFGPRAAAVDLDLCLERAELGLKPHLALQAVVRAVRQSGHYT